MKDGQRGRAEAPVLSRDVSFRLNQKTANFKAAFSSRAMQWRPMAEEKAKESTCANRVSLHKNNNNNKGGQSLVVLRIHISVALQQKTANFKAAFLSRQMQWSVLTEEKQKNELAT